MSALAALEGVCHTANLPYEAEWLPALDRLGALLAAGQSRTNLVGDASAAGLISHVLEALTVAAVAVRALGRAPRRAVDVGAGAGLAALTLALAWPTAQIVAIEPRKLRAAFTAETARALELRNLRVIAKTLHSAAWDEPFELATARAVWPLPDWPQRAGALLTADGVAVVHTLGPATTLPERLVVSGWRLRAAGDVPGSKAYAVAAMGRALG